MPPVPEESLAAWQAVLTDLRDKRDELNDPAVIWYRGHANADWTLQPTLIRSPNGRTNEAIFEQQFVKHAPRLLPQPRTTDWENVFEMQHHGLPTRLLDWTRTFAVAVFFALSEDHPRSRIFLLDPYRLNLASGYHDLIRTANAARDDFHKSILENHESGLKPIAVEAPFQNNRMYAQQSAFTVYRSSDEPLDMAVAEAVRVVDIPAQARAGAEEFLELAGVNAASVFPDITGFVQFVRRIVPLA
jgi:hypothetical protein